MGHILWPSDSVNESIKAIRGAIGRIIEILVKKEGIPCTLSGITCGFDPVTGLATDPFCPVCGGVFFTNAISGILVTGHVRWRGSEMPILQAGGTLPEGDCSVTIEYTTANENNIKRAKNFIVDGKLMVLDNYRVKGVPQPNRIQIVMNEEANQ